MSYAKIISDRDLRRFIAANSSDWVPSGILRINYSQITDKYIYENIETASKLKDLFSALFFQISNNSIPIDMIPVALRGIYYIVHSSETDDDLLEEQINFTDGRQTTRPVDVNRLLDCVTEIPLFSRFNFKISGDQLPEITGNIINIKTAVINVLNNSLEKLAVQNPGIERFSVEFTRLAKEGLFISKEITPDNVIIKIEDKFGGIDNSLLAPGKYNYGNIQYPLAIDKGVTTKKRANGIGLTMSFFIMTLHKGDLKIYNNSLGGATVELIFPLDKPALPA